MMRSLQQNAIYYDKFDCLTKSTTHTKQTLWMFRDSSVQICLTSNIWILSILNVNVITFYRFKFDFHWWAHNNRIQQHRYGLKMFQFQFLCMQIGDQGGMHTLLYTLSNGIYSGTSSVDEICVLSIVAPDVCYQSRHSRQKNNYSHSVAISSAAAPSILTIFGEKGNAFLCTTIKSKYYNLDCIRSFVHVLSHTRTLFRFSFCSFTTVHNDSYPMLVNIKCYRVILLCAYVYAFSVYVHLDIYRTF